MFVNLLITIVAFVVVLGVLVFVHELGHFLLAKSMGVGVETFSLGFGKRLFGWRHGETDYRISAVPLGGYVKMYGEDPTTDIPEDQRAKSFTHKAVWKRFLVVLAGPVFNILLAFVVIFGVIKVTGMTELLPQIGGFSKDSPAAAAGMQPGDLITEVNNLPVKTWEAMTDQIRASDGNTIVFKADRDGQLLLFEVTPVATPGKTMFGEETTHYAVGIQSGPYFDHAPMGFGASFKRSVKETANLCVLMVQIIIKLFDGTVSTKTLGGPILVAEMAGEQAQSGLLSFLFFLALFSVNLGVLNLLPIPVMDGGHLLMYIVEGIKGKPVGEKFQEVLNKIGFAILAALMVLVFYNDGLRIFKRLTSPGVPQEITVVLQQYPMPKLSPELAFIGLAEPKLLKKMQTGYRVDRAMYDDITGEQPNQWRPDWYVVGMGPDVKPLFVDIKEQAQGFPVYVAEYGLGRWDITRAANSIADFVEIARLLNTAVADDVIDKESFFTKITGFTDDFSIWKECLESIIDARNNDDF